MDSEISLAEYTFTPDGVMGVGVWHRECSKAVYALGWLVDDGLSMEQAMKAVEAHHRTLHSDALPHAA